MDISEGTPRERPGPSRNEASGGRLCAVVAIGGGIVAGMSQKTRPLQI